MLHYHAVLPRHEETVDLLTSHGKTGPQWLHKQQKDLGDWHFLTPFCNHQLPRQKTFPIILFSPDWHKIWKMYQHQSSKFKELG